VPTMGFGFKELGKHIMQIDTIVWFASWTHGPTLIAPCGCVT
jgi:hypothetical protein